MPGSSDLPTYVPCQHCQNVCDFTPPSQPLQPTVDIQALISNTIPSEAQATEMLAHLGVEEAELTRCREKTRRVRHVLAQLEEHEDALNQRVQRRRSWLAPIRKLPAEVLEMIFADLCLVDDPDEYSLVIYSDDIPTPRSYSISDLEDRGFMKRTIVQTCVLSQVCCYWSEVVFSSPRLWSSISIDVAKIDEKHAALVKFYLRNSGQYPLKIDLREHIEHCTPADYEEIEDAHDALGETGFSVFCSLMQQSYRFAEFRCSYSDNLIALLDPEDMGIGKNKFPLLLSFYDYRDASTTATNPQWFWKSIKAAPIKRLSLYRLGSLDYLPCDHVQSLVIRIPDRWSLLLNFLGRLPRLESLTLHFVKLDQSSPFRPIILPQLRDLVITAEWPPANLDPFFAVLALPMLSSLKLTAGDDVFFDDAMGPWDLSVTFSPMLRSSPLLRDVALHIFTSPISATAATGMLRVLPNLTHLTLEYRVTQTEPSVISVLCSRMQLTHNVPKISESEILLPCLQYLAFHERWFECGDADKCISTTGHFLDMVEARKQESGSLQDVSLVFCRDGQCDKPLRLLFPESLASRVTTLKATGIRRCNIRLPTYG